MPPGADQATSGKPPAIGDHEGDDSDRIVAFSARALGSALRFKVRAPAGTGDEVVAAAESAWKEVQAEFEAVDRALSRFRDDSELTRLNRLAGSGRIVRVSWRLRRTLAALDRAGRITDGLFDARVLGTLERIGERGADLGPAGDDGAATARPADGPAGDSVDGDGVGAAWAPGDDSAAGDEPDLVAASGSAAGDPEATDGAGARDARRWRVHVPVVPVDSGGMGKGLAIRWARDRAAALLPTGCGLLLEAGGDLACAGEPPFDAWSIGVEDPAAADVHEAPPVVVIEMWSGAIATSSVRVRRWVGPDGRPVHHIVDPRTGEPARTGLIAVTVAAPDPAWAEVWSKALFLVGRDAIGEEARTRGMAAWWIDDLGRLGMTPEARIRTVEAAEARLG